MKGEDDESINRLIISTRKMISESYRKTVMRHVLLTAIWSIAAGVHLATVVSYGMNQQWGFCAWSTVMASVTFAMTVQNYRAVGQIIVERFQIKP